ncbi:hypothetical protein PFISCL1PPCAC_21493, partial [Pristionchus fissidentatus]
IRMSELEPARFTKCDSCHVNLPTPLDFCSASLTQLRLLECGHLQCDQCRKDNEAGSGKLWCESCETLCDSSPLPYKPAAEVKSVKQRKESCVHHRRWKDLHCPCGEVVCLMCAKRSHADHFNYEELFMIGSRMETEIARMSFLKKILTKERQETGKKIKKIDRVIQLSKNAIASKCTLIISQAISRCLDLMTQVEKVGRVKCRSLERRGISIQQTLKKIRKATEAATRGRSTSILSNRLDEQKKALAITASFEQEYKKSKATAACESDPVLKVEFTTADNSILSQIACIGAEITTNLIDTNGNDRQVETFPTPLMACTKSYAVLYSTPFVRFQEAMLIRRRREGTVGARFAQLGRAAAALVVTPPSHDCIHMSALSSAALPSALRYKLTCTGRESAAANRFDATEKVSTQQLPVKNAMDVEEIDLNKERTGFIQTLPTSLKGWKPIRVEKKTTQRGLDGDRDLPSPSSP